MRDQAKPLSPLLPMCSATENWNNLVSAASRLLFGWQGALVGQSDPLQDDKKDT